MIQQKESVPDSQGWSYCEFCGWRKGKIVYFDDDAYLSNPNESIDISWSNWGEFFFTYHNDQYRAFVQPNDHKESFHLKKQYYIQRPFFIIPMITVHVGHIIIDLLEQVYHMMLKYYGMDICEHFSSFIFVVVIFSSTVSYTFHSHSSILGMIRKDAIIIIDVASVDERNVLQEKLLVNSFLNDYDNFGATLRLLTDIPIFTTSFFDEFNDLQADIIFRHLHVGLDVSKTFYYDGFEYRPCVFNMMYDADVQEFASNYQRFRDYVQGYDEEKNRNPYISNDLSALARDIPSDLLPFQRSIQLTHRQLRLQWTSHDTTRDVNALLIRRRGSRIILNEESIIKLLVSYNINCKEVDLMEVPFTEQVVLFAEADILIATAGTAVHNLIFMRPHSVVIIVMQVCRLKK
jgi:hypothetical protein